MGSYHNFAFYHRMFLERPNSQEIQKKMRAIEGFISHYLPDDFAPATGLLKITISEYERSKNPPVSTFLNEQKGSAIGKIHIIKMNDASEDELIQFYSMKNLRCSSLPVNHSGLMDNDSDKHLSITVFQHDTPEDVLLSLDKLYPELGLYQRYLELDIDPPSALEADMEPKQESPKPISISRQEVLNWIDENLK